MTPLQFVIYAKALREKIGGDIEISCFYDLPTIHTTQAAGTKGFEARGMKKVDKLLDGVEAGDYHPKPSQLCWWCEYRSRFDINEQIWYCPYYSQWRPDNKTFDVEFEWKGPENHQKVLQKYAERKIQEDGENATLKGQFDFDF